MLGLLLRPREDNCHKIVVGTAPTCFTVGVDVVCNDECVGKKCIIGLNTNNTLTGIGNTSGDKNTKMLGIHAHPVLHL